MQINELRITSPGVLDDVSNFIEILGNPNQSLDGLTIVVLDGEGNPGMIQQVYQLAGGVTDANGVFLLAPAPEVSGYPFEPGDIASEVDLAAGPAAYFLVENFVSPFNPDLDLNDDGAVELAPWDRVLDQVAVVDGDDAPDFGYGGPVFGPDFGVAPAGLRALPDGADTYGILPLESTDFDTPGALNAAPQLPTPGVLTAGEVIAAPGAAVPVPGSASGSVSAVLEQAGGQEVLRYTIALQGVDLVRNEADRVDANDVTAVQFQFGALGQTGPHALNVFGNPRMDDRNVSVNYGTETITGVWDPSDANFGGDGVRDPEDSVSLAAARAALLSGGVYLEVHTVGFDAPNTGALRGQVEAFDLRESFTIPEIQGAGHVSPLAGSFGGFLAGGGDLIAERLVRTSGVVTAVDGRGFYLQDPVGDGNIATSDAIFVATDGAPTVNRGQSVEVVGRVAEVVPGGFGSGNLPTTQLLASAVVIQEPSVALFPAAVDIGPGGRLPPTEVIEDDAFQSFNPVTDGADFFESLEGMLVSLDHGVVVAGTNSFGELYVVADETAATGLNQRGALTISPDDFNPERIQIQADPDISPGFETPVVDPLIQVAGVRGVVSYDFGSYQIVPTAGFAVTEGPLLGPEFTVFEGDAIRLTIATYNVDNLDPNDEDGDTDVADGRFEAIAEQIVSNLASPDIIGLQEVQDNSGSEDNFTTSASQTLQMLVDAIAEAGGPDYAFIDNDLIGNNASGGQTGGNIRTAFLYNPARVATEATGNLDVFDGLQGPGQPFEDAPLPLAVPFRFTGVEDPAAGGAPTPGTDFLVVNAHFSSKAGSAPLMGAVQPVEARQEDPAVNGGLDARKAQAGAAALQDLIAEHTTGARAGLGLVVLGGFNEFDFVSPVSEVLPGPDVGGLPRLFNTTELVPREDRYTVNSDGNAQPLDHILLDSTFAATAEVDIVHTNSEFAARPGRASDHDPVLVRLAYGSEIARFQVGAGAENNRFEGSPGDDVLAGYFGDDTLEGSTGSDLLHGGPGTDTVTYTALRANLQVRLEEGGAIRVSDFADQDRLIEVERIGLLDGDLIYDVAIEEAGIVYRLYRAGLGRRPDEDGLRFNTAAVEAGFPPIALATTFVGSPEFRDRFGDTLDFRSYVDALYINTLGRIADFGGRDFWVAALEAGAVDAPGALLAFSESPEHVARVSLDVDDGIFIPAEDFLV